MISISREILAKLNLAFSSSNNVSFSRKVFQSYKEISAEVAHTVHCFLLLFSGAAPFHTRKEASTVGCNQCCQLCLFHLSPENDLMEFQKTFERINFAGRKYNVFLSPNL